MSEHFAGPRRLDSMNSTQVVVLSLALAAGLAAFGASAPSLSAASDEAAPAPPAPPPGFELEVSPQDPSASAPGAEDPKQTPEQLAQAEAIWRAYETRWAGTESYEAQFDQRIEMPGVGAEVLSAGRFYFAKPDLVRWEYTDGPPQTVVGDGRWIWVYQPDLEQVYQVDYATAFGEGGLVALLAGREGLAERYHATLAPEGENSVVFDLRPTGNAMGAIRVAVDREFFDLKTVIFQDPAGSTTHMTFESVLRNQGVDASLFSFTPPKGVDIIRDPAG